MMKIKHLFLVLVVLLLGCTQDQAGVVKDQVDTGGTHTGIIPAGALDGVVYVKIKEGANKALSANRVGGAIAVSSTGMSELDQLFQKISASSMEPVFHVEGKFEARKRRAGLHLWYKVDFSKQTPLKVAASGFQELREIDIVEFEVETVLIGNSADVIEAAPRAVRASTNTIIRDTHAPFNDPRLNEQWHYNNTGENINSKLGADINLFKAWGIETGRSEVIVAIIDTGVDFNHEDLQANMWVNTNTDPTNPYKDGVHGWNFADKTAVITPMDHGTHVAGTVGAINNNGLGVAGVAGGSGAVGTGAVGTGVRIMTLQNFILKDGKEVSGGVDGFARAFEYAADNGAVIAQNSWGYPTQTETPQIIQEAISYFIDNAGMDENKVQTGPMKGGIVVFSAGNYGNTTNIAQAPGSYHKVVSVANMGPDYSAAFHSQYGRWVSITAPGGVTVKDPNSGIEYVETNGILSTITDNKYGFMQGTSMAAPHVSGVAALVISSIGVGTPGFTPEMLKERLLKGAHKIENYNVSKYNRNLGAGLIDAHKVLTGEDIVLSIPVPVTDLVADWTPRKAIKLEWSVTADATFGKAFSYDILVSERVLVAADFESLPSDVIFRNIRTGSATVGAKLQAAIIGLDIGTHYYVAISSINLDYGRSATMMTVDGVTDPGTPPEPVTDLVGTWTSTSVNLSWSVTSDSDTGRPRLYDILYSKHDLTGADFDNIPDGAVKSTVNITSQAVGDKLTRSFKNLESGETYYVSITAVDIDDMRSSPMMITNKKDVITTPPTVTNPTMADIKLVGLNKSTTLDLKSYFNDAEGVANLTFEVEATPNDIAEMTISNGVVNIVSKKYGTAAVKVKATNAGGLSVEHPTGFKIVCEDGSTPPPEPPVTGEINIYPNPVINILNIAMESRQTVEVSLYNAMGARVISKSVNVDVGVAGQLDLSKISGGVYTVVMKYAGKEVKQRITKL